MKAFGPPHAAEHLEVCPVPVGQKCLHCEEVFIEGDQGFMVGCSPDISETLEIGQHRECFFRSIFGSVAHQKKTCTCFGGTEEDPVGMTKREAAKAALEFALK